MAALPETRSKRPRPISCAEPTPSFAPSRPHPPRLGEAQTGPWRSANQVLRQRLPDVRRTAGEIGSTVALLFGRRWWWKTLIVLLAMAVMTFLGFWQLDRLDQRRAFNQQRQAALAAPPIELSGATLPQGDLRDRQATALGEFDYARQVAIRNQSNAGQPGFHLVTPLLIAGSDQAVLVNRGWIPVDEADPASWRSFDEQQICVEPTLSAGPWRNANNCPQYGILQPTRRRPDGTVSALPQDTVTGWYRLDIEAIRQTLPYPLLPVVLQLTPDRLAVRGQGSGVSDCSSPLAPRPCRSSVLPHRIEPDISFSEGNHFSYALQWFGFAITAAAVYISVARRAE